MGFLDEMKGSLSNMGVGLTQKANDLSGSARISFQIREEEKKLQEKMIELGKVMFELHGEEAKRLCPELYHEIDDLRQTLENNKKELAICKGLQICPNCGAEQPKEALHCTVCGMNMEEAARIISDMQPQETICPTCGNKVAPGARFCTSCGTQVGM